MRRTILAAAGAAAFACGFAPRLLRAQEPEGPQADSIEVVGNRRVSLPTILNTVGIPLHTALTFRDIQRAIHNLYQLGQFDDIQIARRPGDLGEEIIVVTVRERPILVRVAVRGVEKLSERQVRERANLVTNHPLNPADVAQAVSEEANQASQYATQARNLSSSGF